MNDLTTLSARELLSRYRARDLSPVEALDAFAARIERVDPGLGAFNTLCLDRARAEAGALEAAYHRGDCLGPLAGVPFAAKDLFDTDGVRTTYGSPMFAEHVPTRDAAAVRRTREAGGIFLGKTQTHEFAWGITSVNRLMGTSRNPWAPDRFSGGSSGGSAVALAAHEVPLALGSDTGGSIRVPSAFCGTVGLKPTYGRISAAGVWPLARSLDHPGPMARDPADVWLFLSVLAGVDPGDPATEDVPLGDPDLAVADRLDGVTVGLCPALHLVRPTEAVERVFQSAVEVVRGLGARLLEVDLPEAELIFPTFGTIQRAEALDTHARAGLFPARSKEYGDDVRERLKLATEVRIEDYLAASAERQRIRAAFARLFRSVDLLLTPVGAGPPLPIGEERLIHFGKEIDFRELVMSYTVPQDLVGLPACTVRAGFDDLGIPVGVQLTGPAWSEARVVGAADDFFQATREVQGRWPELTGAAMGA